MNFKNMEQCFIDPDLDIVEEKMMMLLKLKGFSRKRRNYLRAASVKQGISFSTTRKDFWEKLKMFSYKMYFLQELLLKNYSLQQVYAQTILS